MCKWEGRSRGAGWQRLAVAMAEGKGKAKAFPRVTGVKPGQGGSGADAPSWDPALRLLCIPRGSRGVLVGGHKGHFAAVRAALTWQRGGDLKRNKFPVVSPCLQCHCARPRPHSTSVSHGVRDHDRSWRAAIAKAGAQESRVQGSQ